MTGPSAGSSSTVPLFSVVTPVYDPPLDVLAATIESVLAQSFARWELILVDDCSSDPEVRRLLRDFAARDDRIEVIEREANGHIVAASNDAVAAARGTFLVLLDHDDLLSPEALARCAAAVERHDDVDYVYSDEDLVDDEGAFLNPFIKPDWSPQRLRGQNYCCHVSVLRTALVRELGGFRTGFEGSQDHDLILRVTERARRIVHVPEVLYHWRIIAGSTAGGSAAKPYAGDAGRRAVQEHLDRAGVGGTVRSLGGGRYATTWHLPPGRRVSIVVATSGAPGEGSAPDRHPVVATVRAALAHTAHADLEVVVVHDDTAPAAVLEMLKQAVGGRLVLARTRSGEADSLSRRWNLGALAASGDRLVLLAEDAVARSDGWVEELVGPLEEPDVGMTGAKLHNADGTVRHAGLALAHGEYLHPFAGFPGDAPGPFGSLVISRETSGLDGDCLALRRADFLALGGLTELSVGVAAIDLGAKVRRSGRRLLFVAGAELVVDRPEPVVPARVARDWLARRWGVPRRDPLLPEFPGVPRPEERARVRRERALALRRTDGGTTTTE